MTQKNPFDEKKASPAPTSDEDRIIEIRFVNNVRIFFNTPTSVWVPRDGDYHARPSEVGEVEVRETTYGLLFKVSSRDKKKRKIKVPWSNIVEILYEPGA